MIQTRKTVPSSVVKGEPRLMRLVMYKSVMILLAGVGALGVAGSRMISLDKMVDTNITVARWSSAG